MLLSCTLMRLKAKTKYVLSNCVTQILYIDKYIYVHSYSYQVKRLFYYMNGERVLPAKSVANVD